MDRQTVTVVNLVLLVVAVATQTPLARQVRLEQVAEAVEVRKILVAVDT